MHKNQRGFGAAWIILLLVAIGILGVCGRLLYQSSRDTSVAPVTSKNQSLKPLMIVTSSGGDCDGPCNHPIYKLYEDGTFEGHKKLTSAEGSELKKLISQTDFLKYSLNTTPKCQSFVDGADQQLLFPHKYEDKTFTPCMLNIPSDDTTFSYITNLIKSHSIK
jgi:hypothetical protein